MSDEPKVPAADSETANNDLWIAKERNRELADEVVRLNKVLEQRTAKINELYDDVRFLRAIVTNLSERKCRK